MAIYRNAPRLHWLLAMLVVTGTGHAQGVDCKRASTAIEHAICSSGPLIKLDVTLATEYQKTLEDDRGLHTALKVTQRRWIAERDSSCIGQAADTMEGCLTTRYSARIEELRSGAAKKAALRYSTASCQKMSDRYRRMGSTHPGESPIAVLSGSSGGGLSIESAEQGYVDDVSALRQWGLKQNPAFKPDASLNHTEGGLIQRLGGHNYYWIKNVQGSASCYSNSWFTVTGGVAHAASAPPVLNTYETEGVYCGEELAFGTLDNASIFFESNYNGSPSMSATIKVATWDMGRFAPACSVTFYYAPHFSAETLNPWKQSCSGQECGRLRQAAFELAAAVQASPSEVRAHYWGRLTPAQRKEYEGTAAEFTDTATEGNVRFEPTDEEPLRIPYVLNSRHRYIATVGHITIGWRTFGDWRVTFEEVGASDPQPDVLFPEPEATFAIGMSKGEVDRVSIEPLEADPLD